MFAKAFMRTGPNVSIVPHFPLPFGTTCNIHAAHMPWFENRNLFDQRTQTGMSAGLPQPVRWECGILSETPDCNDSQKQCLAVNCWQLLSQYTDTQGVSFGPIISHISTHTHFVLGPMLGWKFTFSHCVKKKKKVLITVLSWNKGVEQTDWSRDRQPAAHMALSLGPLLWLSVT